MISAQKKSSSKLTDFLYDEKEDRPKASSFTSKIDQSQPNNPNEEDPFVMAQLKCILDQSCKVTQRKKVGRLFD